MPNIQIGTTIIPFPDSGSPQNWAPAVVAFAVAVQNQFLISGSPYDLPPIVMTLSSNSNPLLQIINCEFNPANVRSFTMPYAIYRVTSIASIPTAYAESGVLTGVYNSVSTSWELQDEFEGPLQDSTGPNPGQAWHSFSMGSGNFVYLTTALLSGSYTTGTISYSAKTELVANI
jgi:hypothetical protein